MFDRFGKIGATSERKGLKTEEQPLTGVEYQNLGGTKALMGVSVRVILMQRRLCAAMGRSPGFAIAPTTLIRSSVEVLEPSLPLRFRVIMDRQLEAKLNRKEYYGPRTNN